MSRFDSMNDQDILKVLWSIKPRCWWHRDPRTNNFVWDEPNIPMPTDEEIDAALARVNKDYIRDRSRSYPVTDDQIDAIYKGFKYLKENGTDIGPDASAWVQSIEDIKTNFPKS